MGKKEDLMREYKRLAKRADQRLVRLEKLSKEKGFQSVTKYSYARAMWDIKHINGDDSKRFNRGINNMTMAQLKKAIKAVNNFLESATSTKKGILKGYSQQAKALNREYGTSFTWQQLAQYFNSGLAAILSADNNLGSKTALVTIGKMQKSKKDIKKGIEQESNRSIVTEEAKKLIEKYAAELGVDVLKGIL